jgi:hypothetical protein
MKAKSKKQQPEKKEKKHKKEQKTKREDRKGYKPRKREEEERERLTRRMLEEAARLAHSDASKTFRGDVWRQGIGQIAGIRHSPKPLFAGFGGGGPGSASLVGAQWTQVGPAPLRANFSSGPGPVAGRVYDIAIDSSGASDQKIYLATVGGIWKSTDGGATWAPKTDRLSWNQMGAVAIDPSNPSIIYAGAIFGPGPSLFRSIDGGETWSTVGGAAMLGQDIFHIVIPSPGVVLVATFIYGVFRSVDGGVSFGNNSPSYNNNAAMLSGQAWDLHLDTSVANKVYACMGGQGIFVSTNGGSTFPTNLFSNPGAPAAGTYNAVTMTQSTNPNNNTLYASVAAAGNASYLGLYKSTNGGGNWAVQAGAAPVAAASGQFGFNQTIGVDPQDSSRLYLGFEDVWLSTNGGGSFGATPVTAGKVHSDNHALAFSPQSHWGALPTRVYVGTDGGFAVSANGGTNWTNLNEGVATILVGLGALDIGRRSAANSKYSYAGSQDNGTSVRTPGLPGTDWTFTLGGDGSQVAVDTWDPTKGYAAANGSYERSTNAGGSWNPGAGLPASVGALAVDPSNGANVYAAGGAPHVWPPQLLQSTNTGANFSLIHTFPAGILCVAVDPSSSSRVWVGLIDGTIWRTDNALAGAASVWNSYSTGLPVGRGATSIAVDPFNSQRVVAGFWGASGVPAPNRSQHVYLTTNNGTNWSDVSGTDGGAANLPDRPVYSVALDPGSSNGLFGIAWSGSRLVVVGLFGTVLTSPDGINYTAQASNAYNTLAAVTWTGSQFVAAGLGGTILTSPDGVVWTLRKEGPSSEALQGVAASGSRIVVTSASFGAVYTSPDGITWTENTTAAPQALLDIVWNGSQFVAVGYGGTIVTSPDGLTWTVRPTPTTENLVAVIWAGSKFVVGGLTGTILTSPDGVTWTVRVSPTANEINGLAFSGSRLVGVLNTGEVVTSVDGISWAVQPSATSSRLIGVAWMGTMFVGVGDRGTIVTSPDGLTWTDHSFGEATFALIAGNDVTVFCSIDSGATWQILGVGLPTAACMALALDWTRTPSLLRVGTDGRSVFELSTSPTARVAVISNLAFGRVSVVSSVTLTAKVFNVGSAPLTVNGFARISGSAAFTSTGVVLPMTIAPGAEADFSLRFQPTATGDATAIFQLASTDPVTPNLNVPMSGTGI